MLIKKQSLLLFLFMEVVVTFKKRIIMKICLKIFNYYGYDFMICNNRGSEQFYRLHRNIAGVNETIQAGNMYENFDESIYDVSAAVNYAKMNGYEDIILIGQSLGTLKVQYYCEQIGDISKVILLSPADMVNRFRSRVDNQYDELISKSKN